MKIILSRKGFDSTNGGCASPILEDGTLLSIPIPSDTDDLKFSDIAHSGITYKQIWDDLLPKHTASEHCHLDPDIRMNVGLQRTERWKSCFGQLGGAQGHLRNQGVEVGDVFLFFGWFCETEIVKEHFQYKKFSQDKHIIYGYLQIGKIVSGEDCNLYDWHPHHDCEKYNTKNNTIYVASDKMVIHNRVYPGYGTFKYNPALVLTAQSNDGRYLTRTKWKLPEWWKEVTVSHHSKKSFHDEYFQSANIGQEFVITDNKHNEEWLEALLQYRE